jgi:starch synthase
VILADKDVSKTLQKYAKDKNIPTLGFQGEEFGDAYEAFYDQISPEL